MNILFIGTACTDKAIQESNKRYYNSQGQVRPQQYFDLSIVEGLSEFSNVTALTIPPVAAFPESKCILYRRKSDVISESAQIKYINLLNLLGIKTLFIMIHIFFYTLYFCATNKKNTTVVLGSITFYMAIPALIASRIAKIKIVAMISDLPEHLINYTVRKSFLKKVLLKLSLGFNRISTNKMDGYVYLTKYMDEVINKYNKPSIVVEGMIKKSLIRKGRKSENYHHVLMYAGTLHARFGIKKLIDCMEYISDKNVQLWVFGTGDYASKIEKISKSNTNIKYMGALEKSEIIKYEKEATLLINPRPSQEEFTKYSFPSKTIEYMSSGTPLLTTRLFGIPDEYFKYVFVFAQEDVISMSKTIEEILSEPLEELNKKGAEAQNFILLNKNNISQSKKIYDFLKSLF